MLTLAKTPLDGALDLERDLAGIAVHEVGYLPAARSVSGADQRARRWEAVKTFTRRLRFSLGSFGDPRLLAFFPLVRKGMELCRARRFDLIVATSPPEVLLLVARKLSRRTGAPWVADFRDLWHHDMVLYRARLATALSGPLNRWAVKTASVLVAVSRGLQKRLAAYTGRDVVLSYNGFMPTDRQGTTSSSSDGKLHIVYTGRVYPGKQDPQPLFRALKALRASVPDLPRRLSVDFYGFADPALRALIDEHGVADCVAQHGFVPHRESLAAQRAAGALLFLDWVDPTAEGMMTGKLFEYLGSRRPVLALGRRANSEAAQVLARTGTGHALTTDDEVLRYLGTLISSERQPDLPHSAVEQFSRERQAAELLEAIASRLRS